VDGRDKPGHDKKAGAPMQNPNAPAVAGQPRLILRLEGGALFLAALYAHWLTGGSWWLFLVLFLMPDVSFAAYLVIPRIGAFAYNAVHSTVGPIALAIYALYFAIPLALSIAIIWLAHAGIDRLLGYGLKYPSAFTDTHLGESGARPDCRSCLHCGTVVVKSA
jgi:hypothetical protein